MAYLLWLFLGAFGAHRFYTARYGTGALMPLLTIIAAQEQFPPLRAVLLLGLVIWLIVDAFRLPKMVREPPGPGGPPIENDSSLYARGTALYEERRDRNVYGMPEDRDP